LDPALELESGANDPMAALLTITMIGVITDDGGSFLATAGLVVIQLLIGSLVGLAAGWLARSTVNGVALGTDGLYPVLTLAVAMLSYAGATLIGGSGFIAVYLCGLYLGNQEIIHRNSIVRFHDAVAWLSQIAMFLVLGLLVFPSRLPEVAAEALLVALVLAFVARPIGVVLSLLAFRVPWRQQAVISWVGLRGATPIILATFPLVEAIPEAQLIFDVVFFVVLTSVLIQGTTLEPVARLFGVTAPFAERPPAPLEAGQPLPDGTALREILIPQGTGVGLVVGEQEHGVARPEAGGSGGHDVGALPLDQHDQRAGRQPQPDQGPTIAVGALRDQDLPQRRTVW
jgi:potassium/hydrogen antiporter